MRGAPRPPGGCSSAADRRAGMRGAAQLLQCPALAGKPLRARPGCCSSRAALQTPALPAAAARLHPAAHAPLPPLPPRLDHRGRRCFLLPLRETQKPQKTNNGLHALPHYGDSACSWTTASARRRRRWTCAACSGRTRWGPPPRLRGRCSSRPRWRYRCARNCCCFVSCKAGLPAQSLSSRLSSR